VRDCDEAVKRGRDLSADNKLVAKALLRKASALLELASCSGDYAPAIRALEQSLTEHYSEETHEKLRRLQAMLRRELPSGDPAVLFDRALSLLLDKVEKKKLGASGTPRSERASRATTDERLGKALLRSPRSPAHRARCCPAHG